MTSIWWSWVHTHYKISSTWCFEIQKEGTFSHPLRLTKNVSLPLYLKLLMLLSRSHDFFFHCQGSAIFFYFCFWTVSPIENIFCLNNVKWDFFKPSGSLKRGSVYVLNHSALVPVQNLHMGIPVQLSDMKFLFFRRYHCVVSGYSLYLFVCLFES